MFLLFGEATLNISKRRTWVNVYFGIMLKRSWIITLLPSAFFLLNIGPITQIKSEAPFYYVGFQRTVLFNDIFNNFGGNSSTIEQEPKTKSHWIETWLFARQIRIELYLYPTSLTSNPAPSLPALKTTSAFKKRNTKWKVRVWCRLKIGIHSMAVPPFKFQVEIYTRCRLKINI